ncbi:hypothetical protein H5410_007921 [Solanum commersonii]|uniref:LysM domain-containing protein n=1 Tax=Solanum commersonii TaxID=4109 RepID=A0A9J6AFE4_SOLCO|nr:hypothetical protein H5410_007921 [Solanum commersonii]
MAKPNDKVLSFILILSLLLFITLVESKITIHEYSNSSLSPKSEIECSKVVNVKDGDTCFDVSHTFGLGSDEFNAINPNLNCTALFVAKAKMSKQDLKVIQIPHRLQLAAGLGISLFFPSVKHRGGENRIMKLKSVGKRNYKILIIS